MIWQAFTLWIGHLIIVKVGMIFIHAEILRAGNEQLLNELEEGVIILDTETKEVVFCNKAANRITFMDPNSESNESLLQNKRIRNHHMDLQIFAHIERELFK